MIPCPRCATVMEDGGPSALDQCGDVELPAHRFVCPKCATVQTLPTGDPWRPTLYVNLPPAKVTV